MNPIFYGIVNNCEVIFYEKKKLRQFLIDFEGKEVEVVIRQPTSPRTLQQNKYLWGVVYKILSDHTGYTKEEINEIKERIIFLQEKYQKMQEKYNEILKNGDPYYNKNLSLNDEEFKPSGYSLATL